MHDMLREYLPILIFLAMAIALGLVLILAALEIKAVKNYKRRVSEQPVVTVAEGEGAAE